MFKAVGRGLPYDQIPTASLLWEIRVIDEAARVCKFDPHFLFECLQRRTVWPARMADPVGVVVTFFVDDVTASYHELVGEWIPGSTRSSPVIVEGTIGEVALVAG